MSTDLCLNVVFSGSGFSEVTDLTGTVVYCVASKVCGLGFNSRRLHQLPREKPRFPVFFFVLAPRLTERIHLPLTLPHPVILKRHGFGVIENNRDRSIYYGLYRPATELPMNSAIATRHRFCQLPSLRSTPMEWTHRGIKRFGVRLSAFERSHTHPYYPNKHFLEYFKLTSLLSPRSRFT